MADKNTSYKIVAGLDIGNGYVKGVADVNDGKSEGIDFPSGVAFQTTQNFVQDRPAQYAEVIGDIFNNMIASFDSQAVRDNTKRIFGRRGITSGYSMEEFDVASSLSKAQQDLSTILVLGSLAGRALQTYWKTYKKLPDDILQVHARLALALPITEYKEYRQTYAEKFTTGTHLVSIHNFETPVRVNIKITNVEVLAEGASAQYAINSAPYSKNLMDAMLADLRKHGMKFEGLTSADLLAAQNTIGIDIGEGTVNFPVFTNGRFNTEASATFNKGYGTILETSRERLQAENHVTYMSRKEIADLLAQQSPSYMMKKRMAPVQKVVDEETNGFVLELLNEFRKVLARAGSYTEVLYVYGGGATPIKDHLYEPLIDTVRNLAGGEDAMFPVLYLDSKYSRFLNREGLYLVARQLANRSR